MSEFLTSLLLISIPSIISFVSAIFIAMMTSKYNRGNIAITQEFQSELNDINYSNNKLIESLKKDINKQMYIFQKKHDIEFETKIALWNSLAEIEVHIDQLWEDNQPVNRKSALETHRVVKVQLRKAEIFLDHELVNDISETLRIFNNYVIGKESLNFSVDSDSRGRGINRNFSLRSQFKNLQDRVKTSILVYNYDGDTPT